MTEAAVLQRTKQPEADFQRGKRIAATGSSPAMWPAPARLEIASPARIRSNSPALRPATRAARTPTQTTRRSLRLAANRSAHRRAQAKSQHCAERRRLRRAKQRTAKPADCAQSLQGGPREPRIAPIASSRIARGRRISRTIICWTSVLPQQSLHQAAATAAPGRSRARSGKQRHHASSENSTSARRRTVLFCADKFNVSALTLMSIQFQRCFSGTVPEQSRRQESGLIDFESRTWSLLIMTVLHLGISKRECGAGKFPQCAKLSLPGWAENPFVIRPLGISVLGRRRRRTNPWSRGDLPSAVVTREDVGRGVQTLASQGAETQHR